MKTKQINKTEIYITKEEIAKAFHIKEKITYISNCVEDGIRIDTEQTQGGTTK